MLADEHLRASINGFCRSRQTTYANKNNAKFQTKLNWSVINKFKSNQIKSFIY